MRNKKKSKEVLETELKHLRQQRKSNSIVSVINNLIRWGGICLISYFFYQSIDTLAGQKTVADIGIALKADIRLSEIFAALLGGSGVAYGWRQRQLRKTTIERLQKRIVYLETKLDNSRTSSGLTPRGDTHPYDEAV